MGKTAIIDLGSNSVRMLIMKINPDGSYKMTEQVKEMVRLSENMGEEKTLKDEPVKRTINTLMLFKKIMNVHEVVNVYPIATAAVRQAANSESFLSLVKEKTGFEFNVIEGEKEAYYDYLGIINTLDVKSCYMIDIGGASTEVALIINRQLIENISIPVGAVTLTELYFKKDNVNLEHLAKAEEEVKKLLDLKWLKGNEDLPIVGLGGTLRTLAKIDRKNVYYPLSTIHNYHINSNELINYFDKLLSMNAKQRKAISGLEKARSDIIIGGIIPLKVLLDYTNCKTMIISGNGLREGVFYEHYSKYVMKKSPLIWDVFYHSIENIMKIYDVNMNHAYHVKKLSLKIFDSLEEIHGMNGAERNLLSAASLLHDIGMYIDYYNHHKHAFYLILNSNIYGSDHKSILMISYIAAMHWLGRDFKEPIDKYSLLLSEDDYKKIVKLSIILGIAEELDRNEFGSIEDVSCNVVGEKVYINARAYHNVDIEIASARKAYKSFEKEFKKKLSINFLEY